MPAFVPPEPVSGAGVVSVWGSDMHDRMYSPLSCTVTGLAMSQITGAERAGSLDSFSNGHNMLDTVLDRLVIPTGGSGLYICETAVLITTMASGANNFGRFRYLINGTAQSEGALIMAQGGSSGWATIVWMGTLSDGGTVGMNVLPHATVPGDYQIRRMVLVRIGNAYGGLPGAQEDVPQDNGVITPVAV